MKTGLINFGNQCFLNVCIQLLVSIDELFNTLKKCDKYIKFHDEYISSESAISPLPFYRHYILMNSL